MSTVLDRVIPPGVRPRLVTVAEYERMIAAGIYTENDRLELLAEEVVEFMPKGPKRVYCNEFIADFCKAKLGARADVRSQNPIVVGDFSEPEPDIVLAQPPRERYLERHPTPADIFLVMEISDSTLAYDREAKALVYARGGIPQYLLFNLQNSAFEDYREPNADGYGFKRTLRAGDALSFVAFPDVEVAVSELLPKKPA